MAFHPGLPDPDNFPFNTWSKMLARRAKSARHDLFGTYNVVGHPELRYVIARYLAATRGINCSPEQIIITNGAQAAFDLLARILLDPGDPVWMEEPGYFSAAAAFVGSGARLMPLRVDDQGWHLDPPVEVPRVTYVTPSCHHPLGVTMPLEQRLKLLRLAASWNSWIIEDDYDSEYRFQGQSIPALQGISASTRVIYVGTFAKVLFPAMRLGFMVVPEYIREGIVSALSVTGQFAPLPTQAALADFIGQGHLVRHLRRMRRLYAARRAYFIETCEKYLGEWLNVRQPDAGIQIVFPFHDDLDDLDDRKISAAAARLGINVSPLTIQYRHSEITQGLVMGFAAANEKITLHGMAQLQKVFRSAITA